MGAAVDTAWLSLEKLPADNVCSNARVRFDAALDSYVLPSFGQDILVCPARREMKAATPGAVTLLEKSRYFAELSILLYLSGAKDLPLTGKLIRPTDLKTGPAFATGSHALPLEKLASKYGNNLESFLARGRDLHAETTSLGDAALRLMPFPRLPITVIIWKESEEFPSRADLLLDSSCELHVPQDIVWATAVISIIMLL